LVPLQVPDWQLSVWVQALPSLHALPSALDGFEQVPVIESHVPALWHWSLAVQVTGLVPTHVPAWQASVWVQALPSLHAFALLLVKTHWPLAGLHASSVQEFPSLQETAPDPTHAPAEQWSPVVQAFPSSHVVRSTTSSAPMSGVDADRVFASKSF